ncbi:hypothetical protein Ddc_00054 [Ditylenchus destructor]|nr:hypothetical protein Ddc_00054 [Ditylenchus destructor]
MYTPWYSLSLIGPQVTTPVFNPGPEKIQSGSVFKLKNYIENAFEKQLWRHRLFCAETEEKTPALDDDTQFPRAVKMKGAVGKATPAEAASDPDYFKPPLFSSEQETDEILSEDEDGVPDEVNWMYHTKEIQAVQDIIRIADNVR